MHITETLFYYSEENHRIQLSKAKTISDYYCFTGKYEKDLKLINLVIEGYILAKSYVPVNEITHPGYPCIMVELTSWDEGNIINGYLFLTEDYSSFYKEVISKCVSYLKVDGSNTKAQVRSILHYISK